MTHRRTLLLLLISPVAMAETGDRFNAIDTDGDRKITPAELRAARHHPAAISRFDKDKNGVLDPDEAAGYLLQQEKLIQDRQKRQARADEAQVGDKARERATDAARQKSVWESKDGRRVQAVFEGVGKCSSIRLRDSDGKVFDVKITNLNDQARDAAFLLGMESVGNSKAKLGDEKWKALLDTKMKAPEKCLFHLYHALTDKYFQTNFTLEQEFDAHLSYYVGGAELSHFRYFVPEMPSGQRWSGSKWIKVDQMEYDKLHQKRNEFWLSAALIDGKSAFYYINACYVLANEGQESIDRYKSIIDKGRKIHPDHIELKKFYTALEDWVPGKNITAEFDQILEKSG